MINYCYSNSRIHVNFFIFFRISEFIKICISCEITKSPNPIVEEAGTNYSDDEDEDNKPGAKDIN